MITHEIITKKSEKWMVNEKAPAIKVPYRLGDDQLTYAEIRDVAIQMIISSLCRQLKGGRNGNRKKSS